MMRTFFLLSIACLSVISCHSQEQIVKLTAVSDTLRARIVFAGDMMGHMPQVEAAWNEQSKTYDYKPVFEFVENKIASADFAVVNLEVPLAGQPYSGYPQFSSPDALATNLKEIGFDMLITANNHALDRGRKGFERTLSTIDSVRLLRTGTFKDSTDKALHNPLFTEVNDIRLAFLNYTYGTNGYKPERPNLINVIDTAAIRWDLAQCKARHADFTIVTIHWGIEYERLANEEQRALARFIRKCGADAIVGSHPHVVEPFERLENANNNTYVPVIYSVGNFVSNQRDRYKDGGIIFELNLEKTRKTVVKSCSYTPVWVFKGNISGKVDYRLISPDCFDSAIKTLEMKESDQVKCKLFFEDTRALLNNL